MTISEQMEGGGGGEGKTKPNDAGWVEMLDEQTGAPYYYSAETGEYRWEMPAGFGGAGGVVQEEDTGALWLSRQEPGALSARSTHERDIGEWEELRDDATGQTYYHHPGTGEVSWSLPPRSAMGLPEGQRPGLMSTHRSGGVFDTGDSMASGE